ncbi:MAG: VWA domain-containing protein [Phycisphaerae bacterium]
MFRHGYTADFADRDRRLPARIAGAEFLVAVAGFYFEQPWWLLSALPALPLLWWSRRALAPLSASRRWSAMVLRALVILLLALLLARPVLTRSHERLTVIAVVDRSRSVPEKLRSEALDYLEQAVTETGDKDLFAVVDVSEQAKISQLPSRSGSVPRRETTLSGNATNLAEGLHMAMAIAPPDTATRIVLVSDGRETAGDVVAAARAAGANDVAVDVLPLQYQYEREVALRRLIAPSRAAEGQTVQLRFVLRSTHQTSGELLLSLNDEPVTLDPETGRNGVDVTLRPGANVHTISLPIGDTGIHEFRAGFVPSEPGDDLIDENNFATAVTIVRGHGRVLVMDANGSEGSPGDAAAIVGALRTGEVPVDYAPAERFARSAASLLETDAVVMVNTPVHMLSLRQQEMLASYVDDLGGGLVMVGGPDSFGAGGWIGSPVAKVLPVDLDPPQKMQMPQGALIIVLDRSGSMSGEKLHICKLAARGAVRSLSRQDHVGVVAFDSSPSWLIEPTTAEDKDAIGERIMQVGAGGGTDIRPALALAADGMETLEASVKHVILLSDGMTAGMDPRPVAARLAQSGVTVSTVAVGQEADMKLLTQIATMTGGRPYQVNDLQKIPRIFVKEAQMVRRSLIVERDFSPVLSDSTHEIVRGVDRLPPLGGYVLTGERGGLSRVLLTNDEGDPLLAAMHAGLGRSVAFTSSGTARWAPQWLAWGGFAGFWQQVVQWARRPGEDRDLDVYTEVDGRTITVTAEVANAADADEITHVAGDVITPEMQRQRLEMSPTGPGQFSGSLRTVQGGSFVVNLRYQRRDSSEPGLSQTIVTVPFSPEFEHFTDNTPLLGDIAAQSKGRMLPPDPTEANLFSREGVSFPRVARPLMMPLMFAWLAVFLLDVAVRRLSVNFRAVARRIRGVLTSWRSKAPAEATIDRLRVQRRKWRERLGSAASADASKRYEAPKAAEPTMPQRPARPAQTAGEHTAKTHEKQEQAASGETGGTHLDRLLKAKRKQRDHSDKAP